MCNTHSQLLCRMQINNIFELFPLKETFNKYPLLIIIITVSIISCENIKPTKEYYSDGKLKQIGTNNKGVFSGLKYTYLENGDLEEIVRYNYGKKTNSATPDKDGGLNNETNYVLRIDKDSSDCIYRFDLGITNSFSDTISYRIDHFDFTSFESKNKIVSGIIYGQDIITQNLEITPDYHIISVMLTDYIHAEDNGKIGFISIPVMQVIQFDLGENDTNCSSSTFIYL